MLKIDLKSDIYALRKWELLESQEFPRNFRMGISREGKIQSHTGGREQEFPVEHLWPVQGADHPSGSQACTKAKQMLHVPVTTESSPILHYSQQALLT